MISHPFRWHRIVVAAFVFMAAIYNVATPIFESPDELYHFSVVKHIADGLGLPVQSRDAQAPWNQEGSQAPLYYLLVSPIARWIDTGDMIVRLRYNPLWHPGDPSVPANKNVVVHSSAEEFPWRGTTLAVHLIRFVSIAMGALTVAATGALVREIAPARRDWAMGAMAIVAFNPMFIFLSASVNNDNLVTLLATLGLLLAARCLNERPGGSREAEMTNRRWLIRRAALAIVIGLATLAKASGLILLAPAALALTVVHLQRREFARWLGSGLLLAAGVALLAGWWFARNLSLYGEWSGIEILADVIGRRLTTPTLLDLAAEFEGFRISFWALFGWANVTTSQPAYVFFDALSLLAMLGLIGYGMRALRSGTRSALLPWLVLVSHVLAQFAAVIRYTLILPASQGRLMFPAIGAIGALLWLGWDRLVEWLGDRLRANGAARRLKAAVPAAMLLIAAQAPFADILPTYAAPEFIDRAALPIDLRPLDVTFDDRIRLLGMTSSSEVGPDGRLSFALYWQCLRPMREDYSVFVSVKGRLLAEVGKLDAYPDRGLFATSDCPAGAIFADRYRMPIDPSAQRPTLLRAHIGLVDRATRRQAMQIDGAGKLLSALVVDLAALPSTAGLPIPEMHAEIDFGGVIRLLGYTLSRDGALPGFITLDLHWLARQKPPDDYTVSLHLLDSRDAIAAQWDAQPLNGDYPTSWWQAGEQVLDSRTLPLPPDLPPGAYRLALGLYRAPDGPRLPVVDAGVRLPYDRIVLDLTLP